MNDMAGKAARATVERTGKVPRYNITAGVREREEPNRTREAGHLDEIQGVVASTLKLPRNGASLLAKTFGVGFIVCLGLIAIITVKKTYVVAAGILPS
jgi:hypothetical protein